MIRKFATLSAFALFAAPVFAETGVGTIQIERRRCGGILFASPPQLTRMLKSLTLLWGLS